MTRLPGLPTPYPSDPLIRPSCRSSPGSRRPPKTTGLGRFNRPPAARAGAVEEGPIGEAHHPFRRAAVGEDVEGAESGDPPIDHRHLSRNYGARQVLLFGSVTEGCIHEHYPENSLGAHACSHGGRSWGSTWTGAIFIARWCGRSLHGRLRRKSREGRHGQVRARLLRRTYCPEASPTFSQRGRVSTWVSGWPGHRFNEHQDTAPFYLTTPTPSALRRLASVWASKEPPAVGWLGFPRPPQPGPLRPRPGSPR